LNNLRFGPRRLADQISVAYVRITNTTSNKTYVGYLTPTPDAPATDVTSRLMAPAYCAVDGGEQLVEATYAVTVAAEHLTILVHQEYRFDTALDNKCEATESAKCRRFWPTVSWALDDQQRTDAAFRVTVVQHYSLDPDRVSGDGLSGAADLVSDIPHVGNVGVNDLAGNGALRKAGAVEVLKNGKVVNWENWHQTGRARVGLPSNKPGVIPPEYGGGTAGCTECVHIHWSWFGLLAKSRIVGQRLLDFSNIESCGTPRCWSDGKPEIEDGSKQTDCIGWTTSVVTQPIDWCDKGSVSTASLATDRTVQMYWDASSSTADTLTQGVTFDGHHYTRGDSYWPRLVNRKHGGNGSIFFAPARALQTVQTLPSVPSRGVALVEPQWPAKHIDTPGTGLPAGWVLPVRVTPGAADRGPFYLRVRSSGPRLLNADPDYSPRFGGTPWVRIYDDHLGGSGQWVRRLGPPHTVQAYEPANGPITGVLVFDQQPSPQQVYLRLDAAPNGVSPYIPSDGTWATAQEQFKPFGLSRGHFTWSTQDGQITIAPPLGPDRYSALWGVFDDQQRCAVTIDLDSTLVNPQAAGNFGFAIAPLSAVQSDQPSGVSVQYEHEAPPDFPAAGSFVRPAVLPSGAWRVDVSPVPAPDIHRPHHIRVTDGAGSMSIEIDGQRIATYTHQPECGRVGIRAWGAAFTFNSVSINGN
jgi:hypothetical protein